MSRQQTLKTKRKMTKRDFLILTIKLFGLNSLVATIFSVLPNNVVFSFGHFDFEVAVWLVIVLIVTVGIFWILTFKANKVVNFLKLDNGFADDRIELGNIKPEDIIKAGVFIIGGLLFIKNVPSLLSNAFWAVKGEIIGLEFTVKDKVNLGISGLNVLIGYLLFANYDIVARRLKAKKDSD
jgi:hypothetical protein